MFDREDGSGPGGRMSRNVRGGALEPCSMDPVTGFFRDGCCHTDHTDVGRHVVCARLTAEFLEFALGRGNDLVTPRPEFAFPGLAAGDRWCLCAARWLEAEEAGAAPGVVLEATHLSTLELIPIELLEAHAV
ncbi:MAG: DUF2237 domain-containing protein [Gammaproteobacteria bacterium]|nr:DUF2237 domain-containing protein [Gammaproteobacteria bacterium]